MTKKILLSLMLITVASASLIADNYNCDENGICDTDTDTVYTDNTGDMNEEENDIDTDGDMNMDIPADDEYTDEQIEEIIKKLQENPEFAEELMEQEGAIAAEEEKEMADKIEDAEEAEEIAVAAETDGNDTLEDDTVDQES